MSLVSHPTVAAESTVDKTVRNWRHCLNNTSGFHHLKVPFDLCFPQQAAHSSDSCPCWPCPHHPQSRSLWGHHCPTDCQHGKVNVEALAHTSLNSYSLIKIRMSKHPGRFRFSRPAIAILLFVCLSSFTWAALSVTDIIALKGLQELLYRKHLGILFFLQHWKLSDMLHQS